MFVVRSLAVTVALSLWIAPCALPLSGYLAGQETGHAVGLASTRASLRGLDGVQVQSVLAVDERAADVSPTRDALRNFVESLLGDANVRSLGTGDPSERPAYLELDVGISTLVVGGETLGWAYVLRLQVMQQVCVEGLPRASGCSVVPTWGTGTSQPTIVATDLATILYAQIADAVDRFLDDYREANPA